MDVPTRMKAVRLHAPGLDGLVFEELDKPSPQPREALVEVHAAAITRNELDWPVDRLPAVPSYELSGVVAAVAPDVRSVAPGDAVYGLTAFDRDGVAAAYAAVPADLLAPKPSRVGHVASAALPLAGLSAWQGLFEHGRLEAGQRVLVLGAAGGVGHLATQLARWRGAHVIGTASAESRAAAQAFGAHEVLEGLGDGALAPVDLVFDTAGGEQLRRAPAFLRPGGRLVSVAEEPPPTDAPTEATYFVVEPSREQLVQLAALVDEGAVQPEIDSVYPLAEAPAAFARSLTRGKRGKVVMLVADDEPA